MHDMKWLKKNWLYALIPLIAILIGYELALINVKSAVTQPTVVETQEEPQTKSVTLSTEEKPVPDAKQIIAATNDYRASKGLQPLTENAKLDQSACLKAQDMVAKNYWAHVSPDGISPSDLANQVGYLYHNLGENLAYGFDTSDNVVTAWEKSPGHEKNMVGDYTETGVCVMGNVSYKNATYSVIVAHYASQR